MDYMNQLTTYLFNLTNEIRFKSGVQPLTYSTELSQMSQIHTNEMYMHCFFLHDNPYTVAVKTLSDRIHYCGLEGHYDIVAENLANYPAVKAGQVAGSFSAFFGSTTKERLLPPEQLSKNIILGWYNSPGHKANLLCPDYNYLGLGLLLYPKVIERQRLNYLLVTQNFGRAR